ncbi:hypothetical protein TWF718_006933 [Orbilia javanica]|uniref:Uncharacterized protein n=1 Tax=Orbilia javanica TaxID=47235 RepID=A0AAN8MTF6_9PEZI
MYFVINTPILLALFQAVLALPGATASGTCNINSADPGNIQKGTGGGSLTLEVRAGNGAYKCSLDETGSGNSWTRQLATARINGSLTVSLPSDLDCQGSFKNSDDLCIIRCENTNSPKDTICSIFEQIDLGDQEDGSDDKEKKVKKREPEPEPKKRRKGGRRNGNNRNNNSMNFSMDSMKIGSGEAVEDFKLAKRDEGDVSDPAGETPELEKRGAGKKKKASKVKKVGKKKKAKKAKKASKKVKKGGRRNGNNRNNNELNFAMDDLDVDNEDEEEEEEDVEEEGGEEEGDDAGDDTELKRFAKRFLEDPQSLKDGLNKRSMDLEPRDPKKKKAVRARARGRRINKKKNTANGAKTGSQNISLSITPAAAVPAEDVPVDESGEVEEPQGGEGDLEKRSVGLESRDPHRRGRRVRKNKKVNTANGAKTGSQTISLNIGPATEEAASVGKRSIEPRDPKKRKKGGVRIRKNKKVNRVNAAKTGSQTIDIKVTSPAPAPAAKKVSTTKTTTKTGKTPYTNSKSPTSNQEDEGPEEDEEAEEEEEVSDEPKVKPNTKPAPPKEEPRQEETEEEGQKEETPVSENTDEPVYRLRFHRN